MNETVLDKACSANNKQQPNTKRNVSMILRHSFRLISEQFSAHRGLMDMWITAHCPVNHIPTAPATTITSHHAHQTAVG